jgi:hypothetical protein
MSEALLQRTAVDLERRLEAVLAKRRVPLSPDGFAELRDVLESWSSIMLTPDGKQISEYDDRWFPVGVRMLVNPVEESRRELLLLQMEYLDSACNSNHANVDKLIQDRDRALTKHTEALRKRREMLIRALSEFPLSRAEVQKLMMSLGAYLDRALLSADVPEEAMPSEAVKAKKRGSKVIDAVERFDHWYLLESTLSIPLRAETDQAAAAASATLSSIKQGGPCSHVDMPKMKKLSSALDSEESFLQQILLPGVTAFPHVEVLASGIAVSNSLRNTDRFLARIEEHISAFAAELEHLERTELTLWTGVELMFSEPYHETGIGEKYLDRFLAGWPGTSTAGVPRPEASNQRSSSESSSRTLSFPPSRTCVAAQLSDVGSVRKIKELHEPIAPYSATIEM